MLSCYLHPFLWDVWLTLCLIYLFIITLNYFINFYVWVFCMHACIPDVQCALGDQKRGLHLLELGLQRFVNSIWVLGIDYGSLRVLCKSSQCL